MGYFTLLKLIFQFIWNQVLIGISFFFCCYTEKLCPPWSSGSSLDLGWNYGHQLEKCIHRRRPKFHRGAVFGRYPQVSITCDLLVRENTLPTNQLLLTSSNAMLEICLSKLLINTVDGRNPKQPPGMVLKPCPNNGIFTISTGDRRISSINSIDRSWWARNTARVHPLQAFDPFELWSWQVGG